MVQKARGKQSVEVASARAQGDPDAKGLVADSDIDLIDLRQLRHFLAVVEQGHFGRAATQLGISKQGVSQSIAALEKSLGVRLFERGQFGAIPTEFGRVLTRHAMVMQAEARNARTEIEGLRKDHRGEITFALGSSFSEFIAPPAISRFTQAYPQVVLKIANVHPANMLQLLAEGELDFVAMGDLGQADTVNVERQPLFQMSNNLIMAADHPLAQADRVSLEALVEHTFVGVWRHDLTERTLRTAFEERGLPLPRTLECDNLLVTRGLLLDEQHLVVANRLFFERELQAGNVVERVVPGLSYTVTYVLFYRRGTIIGRATLALMRELQRVATERFGDSMLQISP
ncbi:MAG: LysR family transcriptional regulator [Gammaproteobacteria bacterium]|nr:LysR family transcriptional regulator [Gammaproteobacteria bacterium]